VPKAAEMMAVVPATPDRVGGVGRILGLRINDGLQLVEAVDQLVDLAVLREDPAPSEVRVGAVLRREAAGGGLQL
jgi:hypothetical protein